MGMSTHIVGFMPPDARWQKMKAARDACVAAGIDIPDEVDDFFGGEEPDDQGREVEIPKRKWNDDMREGFEVQVQDIPEGVTVIRFYNSY